MFCTECGAALDGNTVCPQCGTPVEGLESAALPDEPEVPEMTDMTEESELPEETEIPEEQEMPEVFEEAAAPDESGEQPAAAEEALPEVDPVEQRRLNVRATLAGVYSAKGYLISTILLVIGAVISIGGALLGKSVGTAIGIIISNALIILQLISMFITYFDALRKENFTGKGLGLFAGVFSVNAVLAWIAAAIFAIAAILVFASPRLLSSVIGNVEGMGGLSGIVNAGYYPSADATKQLFTMMYAFGVIFVIAAVVSALLALFYHRCQSKMAKSVQYSLNAGEYMVTNVRGVRFWSLIQGIASLFSSAALIVTAIMAKTAIVSAIGSICVGLSYLFYHGWMKRSFRSRKELRRTGELGDM